MAEWLAKDYKMEPWAAHLLIGYQGKYDVITVAGLWDCVSLAGYYRNDKLCVSAQSGFGTVRTGIVALGDG